MRHKQHIKLCELQHARLSPTLPFPNWCCKSAFRSVLPLADLHFQLAAAAAASQLIPEDPSAMYCAAAHVRYSHSSLYAAAPAISAPLCSLRKRSATDMSSGVVTLMLV